MKSAARSLVARICVGLGIATIAASVGFWLGTIRSGYIENRFQIAARLAHNAQIDAGLFDELHHNNDILIRGSYLYLQTLPTWLRWLHPSKFPDSDASIKKQSSALKASLDRTSEASTPSESTESFIRTYMGTHSEVQMPQSFIDQINEIIETDGSPK